MKEKDVPQDKGIYGRWHGINYAVDEEGNYVLTPSSGWEPANWANRQAWDLLDQELAEVLEEVRKGRRSPLAYHMARSLMDVKMLSRYTGLACWRVKRHCKPLVFKRLNRTLLERYAKIFKMTADQLMEVP